MIAKQWLGGNEMVKVLGKSVQFYKENIGKLAWRNFREFIYFVACFFHFPVSMELCGVCVCVCVCTCACNVYVCVCVCVCVCVRACSVYVLLCAKACAVWTCRFWRTGNSRYWLSFFLFCNFEIFVIESAKI